MVQLLDLPLEILTIICSFFCFHCDNPDYDAELKGNPDQKQLEALSLSCKKLQAAAQHFVFHVVTDERNVVSRVRTLIARPDLASHVLVLNLTRSLCEDAWENFDKDADYDTSLNTAACEEPLNMERQSSFMLLSLAPNITKLKMQIVSGPYDYPRFIPSTKPSLLDAGNLFAKLQVLRVESPVYDTRGLDLASPVLEDVLLAARNLRELRLLGCHISSDMVGAMSMTHIRPVLGQLLQLNLSIESVSSNATDLMPLRRWMARCSSLQTLLLYVQRIGDGGVRAEDIIRALEPLGQTMKELYIFLYYPIGGFCHSGSFESFECLESLHIPTFMLCEWPPMGADGSCANSLANMLPRTVKRLTLYTHAANCQAWKHAHDLARYFEARADDWALKRLRIMIDDDCSVDGIPRDDKACIAAGWKLKQAYAGTKVRVYISFGHDTVLYTETGAVREGDDDESVYYLWSTGDEYCSSASDDSDCEESAYTES